jgi:tetratricopeptide (TPR) repeat protein
MESSWLIYLTKISENSIFGKYIEAVLLQMQSMQFESMVAFFETVHEFNTNNNESYILGVDLDQAQNFIDIQIELLGRSSGIPPFDYVRANLLRIQSNLPHISKQYYLSYLNYLRCGNLEMSLLSLRRFFDYSIADNESSSLQYLCLNLASLYMNLNYRTEAIKSVHQAVPFARDANDQECLSYALCWIQNFGSDYLQDQILNSPSDWEILYNRTKNLNQPYLEAMCGLGIAKFRLQTGSNQELVKSYLDSCQTIIIKNKLPLENTLNLIRVCSLEYAGLNSKALQLLEYMYTNINLENISATDYSLLLSKLAERHFQIGNSNRALEILKKAKEKFPFLHAWQAAHDWINVASMLAFDEFFHRGDYSKARCHIDQMWNYSKPEMKLVLKCKKALLMMQLGQPRLVFGPNIGIQDHARIDRDWIVFGNEEHI